MSGGYFNYNQFRIDDILEKLEEARREVLEWSVVEDVDRKECEDILENINHTKQLLQLSRINVHRLDWLLSGDDGVEDYFERLGQDLDDLYAEEFGDNEEGV